MTEVEDQKKYLRKWIKRYRIVTWIIVIFVFLLVAEAIVGFILIGFNATLLNIPLAILFSAIGINNILLIRNSQEILSILEEQSTVTPQEEENL